MDASCGRRARCDPLACRSPSPWTSRAPTGILPVAALSGGWERGVKSRPVEKSSLHYHGEPLNNQYFQAMSAGSLTSLEPTTLTWRSSRQHHPRLQR
eukprot:160504-Hanusia_phi.AAC.1